MLQSHRLRSVQRLPRETVVRRNILLDQELLNGARQKPGCSVPIAGIYSSDIRSPQELCYSFLNGPSLLVSGAVRVQRQENREYCTLAQDDACKYFDVYLLYPLGRQLRAIG